MDKNRSIGEDNLTDYNVIGIIAIVTMVFVIPALKCCPSREGWNRCSLHAVSTVKFIDEEFHFVILKDLIGFHILFAKVNKKQIVNMNRYEMFVISFCSCNLRWAKQFIPLFLYFLINKFPSESGNQMKIRKKFVRFFHS